MSITSEIRLRVRKEGDVVLNQLSAKLNDVAKRSTLTSAKFKDLSATLKQTDSQIKTKSINALNDYSRAWRELANNVDITSKEFKEATREAQRFEQAAAKAQGRRGGGGRLAGLAKGAGAVAASGIFGGPEGAVGAGIGLVFGGPMGAAVGGAIGAQVGQARQQLGATATYAADLQKQRIALAGLTKDYGEYQNALQRVERLSQKFQIPQEIITRQFTKLAASVIGAGGNLDDTEKAFRGVAAGIRGTGGDLQDLSSALTATAQVFSKGKVSAEELRQQIGERLPGAFTLFAQSLNMTPAELDKALEQGQVSLQDFQKFSELLFDKFGKSSEAIVNGPAAAGERLQVQLSKLSENVGKLLAPIGAAFQNVFTEIIRLINGAAVALNKLFKIDLSGEVENLTKQVSEFEVVPEGETSKEKQLRLKTLNRLRKDLKQAIRQRDLLSIGAGGDGGPTGLPGVDSGDQGADKLAKELERSLALGEKLFTQYSRMLVLTGETSKFERKRLQIIYDYQDRAEKIAGLKNEEQKINLNILNDEIKREQNNRLDLEILRDKLATFYKIAGIDFKNIEGLGKKAFGKDISFAEAAEMPQMAGKKDTAGKIADGLAPKIKELKDDLNPIKVATETITQGAFAIGDAFSSAFGEIITGSASVTEALSNAFKKIGEAFISMALEIIAKQITLIILQTIFNALSGFAGGGGGIKGTEGLGAKAFSGSGVGMKGFTSGLELMPGLADGGFVTKPTTALIGEGGEPEYVIPASKMRTAMARYSTGARGSSVINGAATNGSDDMSTGNQSAPGTIDVRYTVERINSVDYVTADQFQNGMKQAAMQGAKQGEQRTLARLQNAPSARRRIGI